ncbi:MAG: biotin--[acetyl-CoA-carboxylase] ligase [Candidatus Aminicenantes bacterium]|nr:MAG: biotin--[acetyl-CoA-carboxylase] ligase [Candidatus Aminicenantes bacterium]
MKIGEKILRVESCSSTNDIARELAIGGEDEGTVVISEEQTQGKGRKGREWFSGRKKGLYISVILRPSKDDISLLPLLAGLAVRDAVFNSVGIRVRLKWPNDIIWNKRKLGGILCESSFLGNKLNYVILGIGLNINHLKEDFPGDIRLFAVSLKMIFKKEIDEEAILEELWKAIDRWYNIFSQGDERKIVHMFQEYSVIPLGKEVTVIMEDGHTSGVYRGIDSRGSLILERKGKKRNFCAAEIETIKGMIKED